MVRRVYLPEAFSDEVTYRLSASRLSDDGGS
jgi:hypothetical protein